MRGTLRRAATARGLGAWRRAGAPSCRVALGGGRRPRGRPAPAPAWASGSVRPGRRGRTGRRDRASARTGRASRSLRRGRCAGARRRRRADRPARLAGRPHARLACLARTGPLAGGEQTLASRRSRRRRPAPATDAADPAARRGQLATTERHPPQGDVERPEQQRQDQQQRPQLGEPVGGRQVVAPRVERGRRSTAAAGGRAERARNGSLAPSMAVLGRRRGDQPDGPPERRRPRPRLGHPDGIGARIDLAERRLVDAGRDLDEVDRRAARDPARPRRRSSRRSRAASRRLDALDVEPGLAAGRSRTSPRCPRSPRPGTSSSRAG